MNCYIFKRDNCQKLFFIPSETGSILKGEQILSKGSKFFPFRVDPFQKGFGVQ